MGGFFSGAGIKMRLMTLSELNQKERNAIALAAEIAKAQNGVPIYDSNGNKHCLFVAPLGLESCMSPIDQLRKLTAMAIDDIGDLLTAAESRTQIPIDIWLMYAKIRQLEDFLYSGEKVVRKFRRKKKVIYDFVKTKRKS